MRILLTLTHILVALVAVLGTVLVTRDDVEHDPPAQPPKALAIDVVRAVACGRSTSASW